MSRRIVVSVDPYEARAALLDGDRVINVEIENAAIGKRKGNVYRGRITAVEPSIDAAFVDYGAAKDGFLPFDEVANRSLSELTGHSRANTRSGLNVGDWVLVQVTKEEVGKKGATLTMHVSLPGRFVVLMPFSDRTGVSRKLGGEERSRLKQIAQQLVLPDGFGCIVRTVGEDEQIAEIQGDLEHLLRIWYEIVDRFKAGSGAGEVHAEAGLALRFVRDYMSIDVAEVLVEDDQSFAELTRFVEARMPQRKGLVKRYAGDLPLFLRYGVERQLDALLDNRVTLPSGGSIVIGQTEALVAIDVNSGRQKQRDIEDTAFKVNMEAAPEIARQCVLRDLGGIIVVDFIDMENEGHRRAVEDALRAAFAIDKARLTFTKIQEFGLLCFSRQRIRQAVDSGVTLACPSCSGTGRVRSPALLAMSALRKIRERLATQGQRAAYVEVTVPVEVANFLNNRKRESLVALEKRYDVMVDVLGDADAMPDDFRVTVLGEVPLERTAIRPAPEPAASPRHPAPAPRPPVAPLRLPSPLPTVAAKDDAVAPLPAPPVPEPRRSPGRERSFLRGLIGRFLGLDELEEVPATPVPTASPAPVTPLRLPSPQPAVAVPAPRPAPEPPPRKDGGRTPAPSSPRPSRDAARRPAQGTAHRAEAPARATGKRPASPGQDRAAPQAPRPATEPRKPHAQPVAPNGDEARDQGLAPAAGEALSKSAKRRRRRRRSQQVTPPVQAPPATSTDQAPPEPVADRPTPTTPRPAMTRAERPAEKPAPATPTKDDAQPADAPRKRTRSRSRKPAPKAEVAVATTRDAGQPTAEIPAPPVPPPVAKPAPAPVVTSEPAKTEPKASARPRRPATTAPAAAADPSAPKKPRARHPRKPARLPGPKADGKAARTPGSDTDVKA